MINTNLFLAECMMILVVSFLGYLTENLWLALTKGVIDNRNMRLPFLLGYGLLMMSVYYLFDLPKNIITYLIKAGVLVMVCELILGLLVEKICHFEWWNYSWLPLHITKYTSIPTTILFACIITFFMDQLFCPLMTYFETMAAEGLLYGAPVLLFLLVFDMIHSFHVMYHKQSLYVIWYIPVRKNIVPPKICNEHASSDF